MRKKEILPFATTWMNLEDIMLSEISQTERQILYDLTNMWNLKKTLKSQTQKQRVEWWLPSVWGK